MVNKYSDEIDSIMVLANLIDVTIGTSISVYNSIRVTCIVNSKIGFTDLFVVYLYFNTNKYNFSINLSGFDKGSDMLSVYNCNDFGEALNKMKELLILYSPISK
ncbi:hypothetical protein D3C87_80910 [compost metagenome]